MTKGLDISNSLGDLSRTSDLDIWLPSRRHICTTPMGASQEEEDRRALT